MNHVNLIGKFQHFVGEVDSQDTGSCFLMQTQHTTLNDNGKHITRKFKHRIVLKDRLHKTFSPLLTPNCEIAIEGYLYKGKVIANDMILL